MTHEEKVREFYREQGRQEEQQRILKLLTQGNFWGACNHYSDESDLCECSGYVLDCTQEKHFEYQTFLEVIHENIGNNFDLEKFVLTGINNLADDSIPKYKEESK
jgi:hypothetical protein